MLIEQVRGLLADGAQRELGLGLVLADAGGAEGARPGSGLAWWGGGTAPAGAAPHPRH